MSSLTKLCKVKKFSFPYLQIVERLPSDKQWNGPDDHCSDRVQHHSSSSWDFLRHTDAGEVEESNWHNRTGNGNHQQVVILDHVEGIDGVFHNATRVVCELGRNSNEVHWHQEQRQNEKSEEAFPADSLKCGNVQTGHKSFFKYHLTRSDDLRQDDKTVADQHIRSVNVAAACG